MVTMGHARKANATTIAIDAVIKKILFLLLLL
jgi:hypothetical protein